MNRLLRPASLIVITISLVLIGFIGWAQWAELDQVTRAPGRVVPFARVQIVQSEADGAIANIAVREGETVEAGELLVELDQVQLEAAVREARVKVAALESRMARNSFSTPCASSVCRASSKAARARGYSAWKK